MKSRSFIFTQNGTYVVEVTQIKRIDTTICYNVDNVGVDNCFLNGFSVYPNPTSGKLMLDFESIHQQLTISVLDIYSKKILEIEMKNQLQIEIDLSEYPSGFYFLQLENLEKVHFIKVVKR